MNGKKITCKQDKKTILRLFYPLAYTVIQIQPIHNQEREQRQQEAIRAIQIQGPLKETYLQFRLERISMVIGILVIVNIVCILLATTQVDLKKIYENKITRPSYGEYDENFTFEIQIEGYENSSETVTMTVGARQYTKEQLEGLASQIGEVLEKRVLGENSSLREIMYPLQLVDKITEYGVLVKWDYDVANLIQSNGALQNEFEEEERETELIAHVMSGEFSIEYTFPVVIKQKGRTAEENLILLYEKAMEEALESSKYDGEIILPTLIDGKEVYYIEKKNQDVLLFWILGIIAAVIGGYTVEQQLYKKKNERDKQIMLDYPDVVNKCALLMSAGMTVLGAWKKMIEEYQQKRDNHTIEYRFVYEEMIVTWYELQNNVNERKAFEDFGRRMKALPYIKFSALLSQNSKKGLQKMSALMELEAIEAFATRKEMAKRLGEEAGTKMLLPMGIMLLLVIFIIMFPAFLTF